MDDVELDEVLVADVDVGLGSSEVRGPVMLYACAQATTSMPLGQHQVSALVSAVQ